MRLLLLLPPLLQLSPLLLQLLRVLLIIMSIKRIMSWRKNHIEITNHVERLYHVGWTDHVGKLCWTFAWKVEEGWLRRLEEKNTCVELCWVARSCVVIVDVNTRTLSSGRHVGIPESRDHQCNNQRYLAGWLLLRLVQWIKNIQRNKNVPKCRTGIVRKGNMISVV